MSTELDRKIAAQLKVSADSLKLAATNLTEIARTLGDPTGGLITQAVERSQAAAAEDHARNKSRMYYRVVELASAGLATDGAHHKQWFLEQILEALGYPIDQIEHSRGIEP